MRLQEFGRGTALLVGVMQHSDRYVTAPLYHTLQSVSVHDRETGESWSLYGVGNHVFISPDGSLIAYDGRLAQQPLYANRRDAPIVVAELDGSNPRVLNRIYGGGIVDWFPDGSRLLVLGTQTFGAKRPALWHVNVTTGAIEKLDEAEQMRNISLSPDGAWAVFLSLFEKGPALEHHLGDERKYRRAAAPRFRRPVRLDRRGRNNARLRPLARVRRRWFCRLEAKYCDWRTDAACGSETDLALYRQWRLGACPQRHSFCFRFL